MFILFIFLCFFNSWGMNLYFKMDANFKKIVLEKKKARLEECISLGQNCYDIEIPDKVKSKVDIGLVEAYEAFEKAQELFYKSNVFYMLENLFGKINYYFCFSMDSENFTLFYSHENFDLTTSFIAESAGENFTFDASNKSISLEKFHSKSEKQTALNWDALQFKGAKKYLETRKDPLSFYRIAPITKAESMNYTESSVKSSSSLGEDKNNSEPCVQVGPFQAEIDREREQGFAQNAFQSSFDISILPTFGSLDSGDEV